MTDFWNRLLTGHILGIVNSYGMVVSEFGSEMREHAATVGTARCRWRWSHAKSLHWLTLEAAPDAEQAVDIRLHLSAKYGLRWWDDGHHDIWHLLAKCAEERAENGQPSLSCEKKVLTPLIRMMMDGDRRDDVSRYVGRHKQCAVYVQDRGVLGLETVLFIYSLTLNNREREEALAAYRAMLERVAVVNTVEYLAFGAVLPSKLSAVQ